MTYIIQTYYVYCKNFQYDEKKATTDIQKAKAYIRNHVEKSVTDAEIESALQQGEDMEPLHSWGGHGVKIETVEEL